MEAKNLKYKTIFFDLWGTVCYTESEGVGKIFADCLGLTKNIDGFKDKMHQIIMTKAFDSMQGMITECLTKLGIEFDEELAQRIEESLKQNIDSSKSYGEVLPVLRKIGFKGIKRIVVSNTYCFSAAHAIENLGLARNFDDFVFSFEAGCLKPDKKIFEIALQKANAFPGEVLMIGDKISSDIEGAKKLGIEAILIDRHNRRKNYAGKKICSFNELLDIVFEK